MITGTLHSGIGTSRISTTYSSLTIEDNPEVRKEAPEIITDIREKFLTARDMFELYLPEPVFTDPDEDPLTLSATLSGGSDLPDWISYTDNGSGSEYFTGIAPGNDSFEIKLTATDTDRLQASSTFQLNIVDKVTCGDIFVVVESMP